MTRGSALARAGSNRLILRAELRSGTDRAIACAFDLAETSVFVATEWSAPLGTSIELRLSFPRLLEPVELAASIDEHCIAGGPGEPSGLRLRFAAHAELTALLERLRVAETGAQPAGRPCRVLLVEDNGFIRDVFEYRLGAFCEQPGAYVVHHADSAELGWKKLDETDHAGGAGSLAYDLVIVDYYLPDETGATLIERVRHDARFAALPIVAMSVGGRDAREASIAAGADLFLDKPLVFRDLFTTLRVLALADATPPAAAGHKKTILVFDDSPMILAITRAALESAGFEVAIAENLTTFEQHRVTLDPDLILVDVQMPEAFGDDVVLTLRECHGVRVPILLVSSLDETELANRARQAHAAGYIQKAAGMTELVRRCKEVLEAVTP